MLLIEHNLRELNRVEYFRILEIIFSEGLEFNSDIAIIKNMVPMESKLMVFLSPESQWIRFLNSKQGTIKSQDVLFLLSYFANKQQE